MPWWAGLIIGIGCLVIGGVLGFLITKNCTKQLRDNPQLLKNKFGQCICKWEENLLKQTLKSNEFNETS